MRLGNRRIAEHHLAVTDTTVKAFLADIGPVQGLGDQQHLEGAAHAETLAAAPSETPAGFQVPGGDTQAARQVLFKIGQSLVDISCGLHGVRCQRRKSRHQGQGGEKRSAVEHWGLHASSV